VLIQEYIPGRADAIWMFSAYSMLAPIVALASHGRKVDGAGPTTDRRARHLSLEPGSCRHDGEGGKGGAVPGHHRRGLPLRRARRPLQAARRQPLNRQQLSALRCRQRLGRAACPLSRPHQPSGAEGRRDRGVSESMNCRSLDDAAAGGRRNGLRLRDYDLLG
jgi:hypothetical protein